MMIVIACCELVRPLSRIKLVKPFQGACHE